MQPLDFLQHCASYSFQLQTLCVGEVPEGWISSGFLRAMHRYPANVLSGFEPRAGAGATFFNLNDLQVRGRCD